MRSGTFILYFPAFVLPTQMLAPLNLRTRVYHTLSWVSPPSLPDNALALIFTCAAGHSERRTLFHETSKLVADKTRAAIDAGLSVILCVGETLEEREANRTKEVVEEQLKPVVEVLKEADWRFVVLTGHLSSGVRKC